MKLLDTHVHVWDARRIRYPWLTDAPSLQSVYLSDQIARAQTLTSGMVAVEADAVPADRLREAEWIAASRGEWPELVAIVAGADLRSGLASQLDALSRIDLIVGVRHQLQSEPVDAWRIDALTEGLAELGRRGWTFDACVRHFQLPALLRVAESAPGTRIVLDHLGKPPVDAGVASREGRAWADTMRRLAELPHVFVKISGLAAEASDRASFEAHADGFIAAAVEAFGAERSMVGSDWPVSADLGAQESLRGWLERIGRVLLPSSSEWDLIAADTGARFYGL